MGLTVAQCADVDALIVPHKQAMKVAYTGFFETPFPSDEALREEWRTLLSSPGTTVLLASDEGRPVGTLAVQVSGTEGWLEKLYVHPDAQGRGVGRKLIECGLGELRRRGCRRANLWVLAVNRPAIEIYQHLGWRQVPSEPYAPYGLPQWRFSIDL